MEINMKDCEQVLGGVEAPLQFNLTLQSEGHNLDLISSPAVDQPFQSLTALQTQLQFLIPSQQLSLIAHPSCPPSVSDLSCNYCFMSASSAPLSLQVQLIAKQAFLLEIQEEIIGRRVAVPPNLCFKINRTKKKCSVCQELVRKNQVVAHLTCKHVYHVDCLTQWQQRSSCCPLCRKRFQ